MLSLIALISSLVFPLVCLGDVQIANIQTRDIVSPLIIEDWSAFRGIIAEDIWLGYDEGGFAIAEDTAWYGKIRGIVGSDTPVEVWIGHSESGSAIYLFAMDNPTPYADAAGDHYGIHPCGVGVVTELDWRKALARALSRKP
jgi:hypothetical protein